MTGLTAETLVLGAAGRARAKFVERLALVIGVASWGVCVLVAGIDRARFLEAYLVAYIFVIGIALGCLALVMVQHLTGGAWGIVIRRTLEAACATLPALAVLFVPLALGVDMLYPWARPGAVATSDLIRHQSLYLNVPFFIGRAVFYFTAWIALALLLVFWSSRQDRDASRGDRRFRLLAAPGLLLYGLTVTFMAVDWIMSLTPEWYSTIFGVLVMGGQALAAVAFVIAVLVALAGYGPLDHLVTPAHLHDLGKLLLAFVMLWAYFNFSQFLIVWSANLPEEIPWYLTRMRGGWGWIFLAIAVGHFALPFVLLLSRDLKRRGRLLARVAAAILVARFVDLFWMITPAFPGSGLEAIALDVVALFGIGGVFLAVFLMVLTRRPLLPVNDPFLAEALEHGSH
jgi:hypothetical protein